MIIEICGFYRVKNPDIMPVLQDWRFGDTGRMKSPAFRQSVNIPVNAGEKP
jgi:hypothetical protein